MGAVNTTISRSGALHPGHFRTTVQRIGVSTRYGPHTPDGITDAALFVANAALIGSGTGKLLTIPVDEQDTFNDLLARAYLFDEHDPVKSMLREQGFTDLGG